jgi:hypothetical protein
LIDVFVSAGRTVKPEQEQFLSNLENLLRQHGMTPRNVGRTDFSSRDPLRAVEDLMRQCSGTVVVAYERTVVTEGYQWTPQRTSVPIHGQTLPTVWNQLEAAMAYMLGHPIFLVVDRNLIKEGMLEKGHDWYVQEVAIDPSTFHEREFLGIFADWNQRVARFHEQKTSEGMKSRTGTIDVSKIPLSELLGHLTTSQVWAIVSALISLLIAVAIVGYQLGSFVTKQ